MSSARKLIKKTIKLYKNVSRETLYRALNTQAKTQLKSRKAREKNKMDSYTVIVYKTGKKRPDIYVVYNLDKALELFEESQVIAQITEVNTKIELYENNTIIKQESNF